SAQGRRIFAVGAPAPGANTRRRRRRCRYAPIAPRAVLLRSAQGRRIFAVGAPAPGCEYPPAAPSLSARPNRTECSAPTEWARQTDIRSRRTRPRVGIPAGGAVVVGTPQAHRGRCSYGVRKAGGYSL